MVNDCAVCYDDLDDESQWDGDNERWLCGVCWRKFESETI
jgi:hypothetical protein